mgnify:CR=1 FL=1
MPPPDIAAPHELDAGTPAEDTPPGEDAGPAVDQGYGVVLNYGLNVETWRGDAGARGHLVSGSFDGRLFMPLGVLNHGFVIAPDGDGSHRYRRLDTSWRSSFPGRALQKAQTPEDLRAGWVAVQAACREALGRSGVAALDVRAAICASQFSWKVTCATVSGSSSGA